MNQNVHVWDVIRALDLSGGHGGMGGGRLGLIDFRVPHGQLRTNGRDFFGIARLFCPVPVNSSYSFVIPIEVMSINGKKVSTLYVNKKLVVITACVQYSIYLSVYFSFFVQCLWKTRVVFACKRWK